MTTLLSKSFETKTISSPVGKQNKWTLKVLVALVRHERGKSPYFSVTGEFFPNGGSIDSPWASCGCIHDRILEHFPSLADAVAFHLCDEDGTPLYAVDNGLYFMQNSEKFGVKTVADHFRISLEDAEKLIRKVRPGKFVMWPNDRHKEANRKRMEILSAWVETQKPRWKAEADAIKAKYFG